GSWNQFCHDFLSLSGGDHRAVKDPVKAFPMVQPNLAAGRNNLNNLPNARRKDSEPKREDAIWKVRADEVELAASALVPVTILNVGNLKTSSPPDSIQDRKLSGQPMMVIKPLSLDSKGLRTEKSVNSLGIQPMGKVLDSVLNVTVVRDEAATEAVDLAGWT